MTTILRCSIRNSPAAIESRIDFDTNGALWGRNVDFYGFFHTTGEMPEGGWTERYYREKPSYIVFSYSTPIAWWSENHGWSRPDVFYSMTTSKHQGKCPINQSIN